MARSHLESFVGHRTDRKLARSYPGSVAIQRRTASSDSQERCYRVMPLTPKQRHKLLMADRTHDADWIAAVIEDYLFEANPEMTLLEIDQELRDAGAQSYLIAAGPRKFRVVTTGRLAMLWAVAAAGMTAEQNRAALAGMRLPMLPT
jgi:hypothetical protein